MEKGAPKLLNEKSNPRSSQRKRKGRKNRQAFASFVQP
jgi:hypothetical protein